MAKYIDADLLRKEIDNVEEGARKVRVSGTDKEAIGADGKVKLCLELKAIINSLQQEEPEKPIPKDLEEAASEYKERVIEETKCHHNALTYAEGYEDALLLIPDAFIAGAKWDRSQMMEEAVTEVEVGMRGDHIEIILDKYVQRAMGIFPGDKVRIIVLPKED